MLAQQCRLVAQPRRGPGPAAGQAAAAANGRPALTSVPHHRLSTRLQAGAGTTAQPTEAGAIAAYKAAAGGEGLEPCVSLLQDAADSKGVKPELVEGALAFLEQTHASPASDVSGTWRLVFSTSTGNRAFQYIPVQEDFVIEPESGYVALESVVGPFQFVISGAVSAWRPQTGELGFQFNAVDIILFGIKLFKVRPKTKPKTYTFFWSNGRVAAARSSAGGLALLRK